jgi:hypothetical protein
LLFVQSIESDVVKLGRKIPMMVKDS